MLRRARGCAKLPGRMRERAGRWELLAVAALTALAAVLRVAAADQSLLGDELFTYEAVREPTLQTVMDFVRSPLEISPPLFFVGSWLTADLGDPTTWLRAPSVGAGILVVPAVWAVGRRTVGERAGLVGAAIMTVSPYAVFFSAEARPYALAMLLTALSTLVLLTALERGRWPWWLLLGITVAAAMYTHYVVVFVVAVQAAWALWVHRDRWLGVVASTALSLALYVPWLPAVLDDRRSPYQEAIGRVWPLDLRYAGTALGEWVTGTPLSPLLDLPGPTGLALLGAALVAAAGGAVWSLWPGPPRRVVALPWRPWQPRGRPRLTGPAAGPGRAGTPVLVVLLAAAAPVGALAWSLVAASIYVPRSFAPSLPFLCLALGALVVWLRPPTGAIAAVALIAALAVGTALELGPQRRTPYDQAAAFIDARAGARDPVLEQGLFDPGMLEAQLDRPRAVYKNDCPEPARAAGDVLRGRVRCARQPGGRRRAVAVARGGQLFVITAAGRRPAGIPLDLVEERAFEGAQGLVV